LYVSLAPPDIGSGTEFQKFLSLASRSSRLPVMRCSGVDSLLSSELAFLDAALIAFDPPAAIPLIPPPPLLLPLLLLELLFAAAPPVTPSNTAVAAA
jgi:hypothetical protein